MLESGETIGYLLQSANIRECFCERPTLGLLRHGAVHVMGDYHKDLIYLKKT